MAKIDLDKIGDIIQSLRSEIHKGIIGQEGLIDGLLIALCANGHLLIEGVPGLAKTRAVHLLSKISGLDFKRLQFTPDLLPADIIGTRIYNQSTASFETKKGPVFAHFILADEINRAPAKVQSALLECMQEKQVTIGEESYPLPSPFFVFATQNPVEQEGTYPLPEAQIDRFMMKLVVEYPDLEEESDIVEMVIQETSLPEVNRLLSEKTILALQEAVRQIHIEKKLIGYITELTDATRDPEKYGLDLDNTILYGASPRASIYLAQVSRAMALMEGRENVIPDDIKKAAPGVMRHRIILTYHAEAEGVKKEEIIERVLSSVKVP
jgi:MoxR-like ATPase